MFLTILNFVIMDEHASNILSSGYQHNRYPSQSKYFMSIHPRYTEQKIDWPPVSSVGQSDGEPRQQQDWYTLQRKFLCCIHFIISADLSSLWSKQLQTKLFITLPSYTNACMSVGGTSELRSC